MKCSCSLTIPQKPIRWTLASGTGQCIVKEADIPECDEKNEGYIESLVWEAFKHAFWNKLESRTIWNVCMVREEILKMLISNKGDTILKEPHTGIRERWGTYE